MRLLFSLLKLLAGINMCIAINLSPRADRPVSLPLRQSLASSNGTTPSTNGAEHDQRDSAEEDRAPWNIKWMDFFKPSDKRGSTSLREHLLSEQAHDDAVVQCLNEITAVVSQTIRYREDKGPRLNKLLEKLERITKSKEVVVRTLVEMLKVRDFVGVIGDAWLASKTNPAQVLEMLQEYLLRQGQVDFVASDLFVPWLKYVNKYWKKSPLAESEWNSLVAASKELKFNDHYPNGLPVPLREQLSEDEVKTFNALFDQAEHTNRRAMEHDGDLSPPVSLSSWSQILR